MSIFFKFYGIPGYNPGKNVQLKGVNKPIMQYLVFFDFTLIQGLKTEAHLVFLAGNNLRKTLFIAQQFEKKLHFKQFFIT